ncbi:MAG: hypothetical protein KDA37_09240, partial [Planctomycetales bacterium]|nr:hypothetical protein [Planctomycetales bacterium]
MRRVAWISLAVICLNGRAYAEPARFWVSSSVVDPDLYVPDIPLVQGSTRFLHIWAQPGATEAAPVSGTLQNLSLNLVTSDPGVDFGFHPGGFFKETRIYNPDLGGGAKRFLMTSPGYDVNDPDLDACFNPNSEAWGVCSMTGLNLGGSGLGAGVGPVCDGNDPFCRMTGGGEPAWLIASIAVQGSGSTLDASLFLQIGPDGMNYEGHRSPDTSVVFDPVSTTPVYLAGQVGSPDSDRNRTDAADMRDASLYGVDANQITSRLFGGQSGDWVTAFGPGGAPGWLDDVTMGSQYPSSLVTVNGSQRANLTTVDGGRLHVAADSALNSQVEIKPGASISGRGWLGVGLDLGGALVLDRDAWSGDAPLNVVGAVNLLGEAELALPPGFSMPPNTVTDYVTILT